MGPQNFNIDFNMFGKVIWEMPKRKSFFSYGMSSLGPREALMAKSHHTLFWICIWTFFRFRQWVGLGKNHPPEQKKSHSDWKSRTWKNPPQKFYQFFSRQTFANFFNIYRKIRLHRYVKQGSGGQRQFTHCIKSPHTKSLLRNNNLYFASRQKRIE